MSKWIKISIFIVLHIVSGYLLGIGCKNTGAIYPMLFEPDKAFLKTIILFLAVFCFSIFSTSLLAILIKPMWIKAISFALSSAAILLGSGQYAQINIALTALYFLLGLYFSYGVSKAVNERIKFSIRPVKENKMMLNIALILLICGSIYLGGKDYVEAFGFEIPDKFLDVLMDQIKQQAPSQLPPEILQEGETMVEQEFERMIGEFEKNYLKPLEPQIPLAFATMLFFPLVTVTSIIDLIPIMLSAITIRILLVLKIIKIKKETQDVERLVLE